MVIITPSNLHRPEENVSVTLYVVFLLSADGAVGWTCGLAKNIQVTNLRCWHRLVTPDATEKHTKIWRTSRYFTGFNVCMSYICKCWWSQVFNWLEDYLIWQHIAETEGARNSKTFSLTRAWQEIFSPSLCLKLLFWILKQRGYFIQTGANS